MNNRYIVVGNLFDGNYHTDPYTALLDARDNGKSILILDGDNAVLFMWGDETSILKFSVFFRSITKMLYRRYFQNEAQTSQE